MDKEAVINELKNLQEIDDPEYAHIEADDLLVKFLRSLGYDDIVDEWVKIDKWYS